MFRAHIFCLLAIATGLGAVVRGEDNEVESGQALLERGYVALTSLPNAEVTVTTRELHAVSNRPGGTSGQSEFRLLSASYQQVRVTWRQPDDWRLVSQRESENNGASMPGRKLVFGKLGEGEAAAMVLNTTTQEPTRITIPAGLFRQEILERAGAGLRGDPVLSALLFNRPDTGLAALGFEEVSRVAVEETNGVRLTQLSATGLSARGRSRVMVWVDDSTGLIARVLQIPADFSGSPMRRFTETVYVYDLSRGSDKADFAMDEGWAAAKPGFSATSGFVPVAEAFALLGGSKMIVATDAAPKPEVRPTIPPAPRTPPAPPSSSPSNLPPSTPPAAVPAGPPASVTVASAPPAPAVEEQLLTPQQMEAIVLVEGDEGVGSGFVAKIRGVDFVVTNQHVIGGNATLRVTTVRGVSLKVGGMFGALGRDIALLRIEGDHQVPVLALAEDPFKTVKLGDKVAVVGNRRGGGVATQVSGVVRGIGPDKIEVDAPFQPGNSGSPIVHVATGEVLGLATYSQTRRLDELDGGADGTAGAKSKGEADKTEQRWFGYRTDGVAKWEAIDLVKWRAQAKRISDFEADSEAIYYAMNGRFKEASSNPRVRLLIDRLEERYSRMGAAPAVVQQEVGEFFRGLRALAETGTKELKTGEYYDFFRTSLYWESSITDQLRFREALAKRLERAAENTSAFLAKMRR